MKVSSEQQAPREAVVTVELDNSDVEPYLDRAYRQIVQRMNIPGFRKGKAPRRIVEQLYGRGYLLNEALDFMVQDVTFKAVQQEALEPAGVPSVSIEQFDPPSFKATVPLAPAVDLGDYGSIRVPKDDVEVEEEEVERLLQRIREDTAVWEPAEGAAQLEDLVTITVVGWIEDDGEQREIVRSENADFIPRANERLPVPGFGEGIAGIQPGETKQFTVDVPEDFENAEYAGKKATFEVTVHSVKRKSLPELDDELAKGVGEGFESLEALRERIRENLRSQQERAQTAKHEEEILSKVVEGATIEISPLLVDHELEHFMEEREEKLKSGRMSFAEYQEFLTTAGKTPEEIREESRSKVEERLKRAYVLREIVRARDLEASDEEIETEVETLAAEAGDEAESVRNLFSDEERRQSIRRMLLNRKVMAHLTAVALGEEAVEATPSPAKAGPAQGSAETPPEARTGEAEQDEPGGN